MGVCSILGDSVVASYFISGAGVRACLHANDCNMLHYNFLGPLVVLIMVTCCLFGLVHTQPTTAAITDSKRFFQARSFYGVYCMFVLCIYHPQPINCAGYLAQ